MPTLLLSEAVAASALSSPVLGAAPSQVFLSFPVLLAEDYKEERKVVHG